VPKDTHHSAAADYVRSATSNEWANFSETDEWIGPTSLRRGPDSMRQKDRTTGPCSVSSNLARRHAADLRWARFAETASSWLSH
jgi:hypothetical protein